MFAVIMVIMTFELWYIFKDCIIKSAFLQFTSVKIIENCRDDGYYCKEHTLKQSMGVVGTHFSLQKKFK